jgi:hypothetical protein
MYRCDDITAETRIAQDVPAMTAQQDSIKPCCLTYDSNGGLSTPCLPGTIVPAALASSLALSGCLVFTALSRPLFELKYAFGEPVRHTAAVDHRKDVKRVGLDQRLPR